MEMHDLIECWDICDIGLRYSLRYKMKIGSLSTLVFETRTVTGSELFSLLTCPHTATFTLLSIFSPLETNSINMQETKLS